MFDIISKPYYWDCDRIYVECDCHYEIIEIYHCDDDGNDIYNIIYHGQYDRRRATYTDFDFKPDDFIMFLKCIKQYVEKDDLLNANIDFVSPSRKNILSIKYDPKDIFSICMYKNKRAKNPVWEVLINKPQAKELFDYIVHKFNWKNHGVIEWNQEKE